MKTSLETKVVYKTTENGEIVTRVTTESAFNDKIKAAMADKKPAPELVKKQAFQYVMAETTDEPLPMCGGSDEIFLGHVNYAFRLAQHNAANDLLNSEDFTPTDEPYDLAPTLAEKAEGRSRLSPEEKAVRDLAKGGIKVTPEQLRAALAAILEAGA